MLYSSQLASQIARHWEEQHPAQAASLKQQGVFHDRVEAASERAGRVLEQSAAKGLEWHQADELATQEYATPPAG